MERNEITITIAAREGRLLASDFLAVVGEALGALNGVVRCVAGEAPFVGTWRIEEITMRSPAAVRLVYEPPESNAALAYEPLTPLFVKGLRVLEKPDEYPACFDDRALAKVGRMMSHLSNGIESLRFFVPGVGETQPSLHVAANAEALRQRRPRYYWATGELRGELGQVTAHGSQSKFVIYDALSDRGIACNFAPEETDRVADSLRKRVSVYGRIKYNRNDHPVAVDVERWAPAPPPQNDVLDLLHALRPDITGGLSSEEYVRGMRDAEG